MYLQWRRSKNSTQVVSVQPIQFCESCFIHREPDQFCNYLLLTGYPSPSTPGSISIAITIWSIETRLVQGRSAIGFLFLLFFFFFLIAGTDVSIFIEDHRLIIRVFQAISFRCFVSVKKISNLLSSNRSRSLFTQIIIILLIVIINKVFVWYFLYKSLYLNIWIMSEKRFFCILLQERWEEFSLFLF